MSAHTPAPWLVHDDGGGPYVTGPGGVVLADAIGPLEGEISAANAHLIAASPVMQAALTKIIEEVRVALINLRPNEQRGQAEALKRIHTQATFALLVAKGKP